MIERLVDTDSEPTPASVLAGAQADRAAADAAEARLLVAACEWADLHPPESIHDAASFHVPGSEHEEQIAGPGAPLVAEFCVAEFAAALGMSTTAGKRLIGHALELRHRLPRVWARVQAGDLPAWRARRVAEATIHATGTGLTPAAAAFVDRMVAPFAHRIGLAALDRLIDQALTRCGDPADPVDPDDPQPPTPDPRHVTIHDQAVAYAGTVRVEAELDLADAHDLDHALTQGAATLAALGNPAPLDARRALALGHLARHQLALDLADNTHDEDSTGTAANLPAARQLVLNVHLAATVTGDTGEVVLDRLATLEHHQQQVLLDQVKAWCSDSHTRITLRPVLDLAAHLTAPGHHIPDQLREQVIQRDRTCAFPWCTRPARRCQIDHITPFDHHHPDTGGRTESCNLAPLCTRHHRLKTHGGWTYTMTTPGTYHWRSPLGHHYQRDPHGTSRLDPPPPRP